MDKPVKEGQLHVQHQKFGKKWKKNWIVLYPASQFGVARLEFFDNKDASTLVEKLNTKRLDKKIVRLADCISILPALTESCPKENMLAFCVETSEKNYLFATEKQASLEWIDKLCEIAFPNSSNGTKRSKMLVTEDNDGASSMEMSVNSIYYSREEVSEFWVTVQKTEAAERCELYGSYVLKADKDCLILKDPKTTKVLYTWPYKLLRRYGRDKVMFSFEAGRRCDSGAGNFTFETKQGNEIFIIVEASIQEQKAQVEENRQSYSSMDSDCPAMLQIKSAIAESLSSSSVNSQTFDPTGDTPNIDPTTILEDLTSKGGLPSKLGSTENCLVKKDSKSKVPEDKEVMKLLKARSLPEPPVLSTKSAVSNTPSSLLKMPKGTSVTPEDPANVYSEPKDSVKAFRPGVDTLYSDPVDSVTGSGIAGSSTSRSRGISEEGKLGPLYSDLYEQVNYEMVKMVVAPKPSSRLQREDHIYDEPEGRAQMPPPAVSYIYDEARPSTDAWKTQGIDDKLGYEYPYNPNTDDYSVPAFQTTKTPKRFKAKGPKPIPAPKPQGKVLSRLPERSTDPDKIRKDGVISTGKTSFNSTNNNNNEAIYSQVVKPGRAMPIPASLINLPPERLCELSVDEKRIKSVYEDLGDI
ncbi:docking protein 1 [Microcaecilia unicolor]|uniref:Docking protein 1 n=1 Tax=Microcaecilia unicolor TaxID=1415580 RepID=A0A6P7X9E4_9AMPH|nr:docking protein 1 [Microcaecilia unicolor]